MKSIIKKLKPRTFDELSIALQTVLDSFSLSDILNWFHHDGYFTHN